MFSNIPEKFLRSMTNAQLRALIRKEGKLANNRIDRLKRTGMWAYNAIVQGKWNTVLSGGVKSPSGKQMDNIIDSRKVIATPSGHFSVNVKNMSRKVLIQQYKQIRQFLSQKTKVSDTRKQINKAVEATGVEAEELTDFYDCMKNVMSILHVDSKAAETTVTELHRAGFTFSDIIARALQMANKYPIDGKNGINEAFDHFIRDDKGNIAYY